MDRREFLRDTGAVLGLNFLRAGGDSSEYEDDAQDVGLHNGGIFVYFDEDSVDRVSAWDQAGIYGEDLTTSVLSNPKNPVSSTRSDSPHFLGLEDLSVDEGTEFDRFSISRRFNYPANDQDVLIDQTNYLPRDGSFLIPELRIENVSDENLILDQDSGDVHDGIQLFKDADISRPYRDQEDYRFFTPDNGSDFFDEGDWEVFPESDYVVVLTDERGVSYGLIEGDTSPEMVVEDADGRGLDYMVGSAELEPGQAVQYTGFVGLHGYGGGDAIHEAEELYDDAKDLVDSSP